MHWPLQQPLHQQIHTLITTTDYLLHDVTSPTAAVAVKATKFKTSFTTPCSEKKHLLSFSSISLWNMFGFTIPQRVKS